MKNLKGLFAGVILIALCFSATAQTVRWGGGPPIEDNTGRILTYKYINTTPGNDTTAGIAPLGDTVNLYPNCWDNLVQPSAVVKASIIYTIPQQAGNFSGDVLEFYGTAGAGAPSVKFRSGLHTTGQVFKFITAGDSTNAITPYKHYYFKFQWNGSYWIEILKSINQ